MKYCCTDFEIKVSDYVGFDKQEDGTWSISGCSQCYVVHRMRFCPYCGKQLTTKYKIEVSNIYGYNVFTDGQGTRHFDTRAEAEEYVLLH